MIQTDAAELIENAQLPDRPKAGSCRSRHPGRKSLRLVKHRKAGLSSSSPPKINNLHEIYLRDI